MRRLPAEHSFISDLVHTYRNAGETFCRVL